MKLKVGVQLFSVMTELANDYLKTLENVAKAGYKYVEYVDVPGNSPEEIGNKVKELGLTAIASHVHFDPFTSTHEDMVKIVEDNVKMHSEAIILPMGIMTTMEEIKTVAAACNEMAALAKAHGMAFYYHNHCQEFYQVEGKTAYEWLVELTDPELVFFEVDTFWATRKKIIHLPLNCPEFPHPHMIRKITKRYCQKEKLQTIIDIIHPFNVSRL